MLKFDLGRRNGKLAVSDADEFADWLQKEKSAWEWLSQHARSNQLVKILWNHLASQWQGIESKFNSYRSNPAEDPNPHLEAFTKAVEATYGQNRLIRSDGPRGSFVLELGKSDPIAAAAACNFFVGLGIPQNDPKALDGAFRALQFEAGITTNIDAERAALDSLRAEWHSRYTELSTKFVEAQGEFDSLRSKSAENLDNQKSEFSDFMVTSREAKSAIEQTYREHMALKAPVEYWASKATEHTKRAGRYRTAASWAGAVVAILIGVATWLLLVDVEKPDYWRLAVVGLFAALGIWLVRIVIRLFLSNLHQASDAEERVTMVETFLSLMSEGHISRDEDRHLVLQALFRPSQTGLVRDEGSPPTVIDLSNKVLKDR